MKPQPTAGAWPTEQVFPALADLPPNDESKIDLRGGLVVALQLILSLGGCGLVHWAMM